jgi:hypothetical protein
MATDKLFSVAGVSTLDGVTKVRFANDELRVKVLMKHGHTDPILIGLDTAMTKLDAVKFIKDLPEFAGVAAQAAIADYLDSNTPKAKAPVAKPAKAPKSTATKAKAPKATAKVADTSEMEDAPF